jgi:adenosylmethionine-8-amino-7-oxononanoate aminotransferase
MATESVVLHRDLHKPPYEVVEASKIYFKLSDGRSILDATGGAAVSCIGHGDERIQKVISSQILKLDYCHSLFFSCPASEELSRALIASTDGKMAKVFIINSGDFNHDKHCRNKF